MNIIMQATGVALLGLFLAGCSDSDDSSRIGAPVDEGPVDEGPGEVQSQDFTQFVKDEINNTSDSREPVEINDLEFGFNDQDNEQAFDELF